MIKHIALVITIIILIILATVTINAVFGDNGLIKQAEYARDLSANSTESEYEGMNRLYDEFANVMIEDKEIPIGPIKVEGVLIPDGFYYVGGTKSEGIVISDNKEDAGKGTSYEVAETLKGNQFVWIPVEDDELFQRYEGYLNGSLDSKIADCTEPYSSGYETEQAEYDSMITSVLENNGFYVGRYEAGTIADSERTATSGITDAVVVKQGAYVYNYIGWNDNNDMSDETGGAVEKSKKFAEENGYTSVISTLVYGIQWDAIMNFIDSNYSNGNCTAESVLVDSSSIGNYTGVLLKTGSNSNYSTKNIYDLAGNVWEWTMEAKDTTNRIFRGGDFAYTGLSAPISNRVNHDSTPIVNAEDVGFRIALYIK